MCVEYKKAELIQLRAGWRLLGAQALGNRELLAKGYKLNKLSPKVLRQSVLESVVNNAVIYLKFVKREYILDVINKNKSRSSCHGSVETNPTRNHEAAGSPPGLAQWVKDLVLPCALVLVADMARIPCCCGSGEGGWLQLQLDL